jgi:hypothetical protein
MGRYPAFHEMMTVTGGRDKFGVHSQEYYQRAYELFHPKGTCELLVAEFEGKPLASLMVFANGKRAWYVYGASNDQERNRMPTYLCSGKPSAGQKRAAVTSTTCGASLTRMKKPSNPNSNPATMDCGESIVSSAASAVK